MQLKSSTLSFGELYNAIGDYYENNGDREALRFECMQPSSDEGWVYFVRFLLEKKHVIEYRIQNDRGVFIAIPSVAIGPHYFSPGEFWDYENASRFTLEATEYGVRHNLQLLDEFLGYRAK